MKTTYETPELFEIGDVETLTLGRRIGTWPDGLPDGCTFEFVTDEDDQDQGR
jgi:hypothetical protein